MIRLFAMTNMYWVPSVTFLCMCTSVITKITVIKKHS
ncbi:hypothetical protein CEY02_08790 [Bacillus pumilus]|uniref:Uncharacterized protein n=1 Tax=Bacillus pumilus TaxID=1408 RepID=A0A2A5IW79_BACPU|nr:hypothetical protein CEY02_08790 [Bacillus pumilus]